MAAHDPIDPVVRLAISQWPDDAPRGAVSTFCVEHGISRKSFYALRKRTLAEGQAAVLEPKSRLPRSSPARLSDDVKALPTNLPPSTVVRKLTTAGVFCLDQVHYLVDARRSLEHVLVEQHDDKITVIDLNGEVLLQTTRPAPGTKYVGRPRRNRNDAPGLSPKS